MTECAFIINFGCPRSGTTYVYKMLRCGHGYMTTKLSESCRLHPVESPDGLLDLADTIYRDHKESNSDIVFVRSVRHPMAILLSFYSLRIAMGVPEVSLRHFQTNPDESVEAQVEIMADAIRRESQNSLAQKAELERRGLGSQWVTMPLDELGHAHIRTPLLADLARWVRDPEANMAAWESFIAETHGTVPIREGRLSMGDTAPEMPSAMWEYYKHELADVARAEGYAL